jgi:hypothetical protein
MAAPSAARTRWRGPARIALVAALLALALRFLWLGAFPFVGEISPEQFGPHFWPRRLVLLTHLAGGTVALLVGPFQLWSGLASRHMDQHRWTGRAYVVAVLVGGLAAFSLSAHTEGLLKALSLQVLGVAWWTTTWMAYRAIRSGRERRHRAWAARSYAVTFSFVTFRLGVEAGAIPYLGPEPVAVLLWVSWVLPLVITEVVLRGSLRAASTIP